MYNKKDRRDIIKNTYELPKPNLIKLKTARANVDMEIINQKISRIIFRLFEFFIFYLKIAPGAN